MGGQSKAIGYKEDVICVYTDLDIGRRIKEERIK